MLPRVCAAIAATLTALLVQMTFVGPLAPWAPASLPAVMVAAVAITTGPGAGLCLGFCVGLMADLGSRHPVGVLALTWLVLGAAVGRYADPRRARRSALTVAACGAALAGAGAQLLLALTQAHGVQLLALPRQALLALAVDAMLLLAILPAVRSVLGRLGPPRLGIQRV